MLRILLNNKLIKITDSKINYLKKKYFLNTNKYIILNILISVNENNKRINKYTKLNKKNKFNLMDFILSDKDIIWSNDKVKRKYLKKIFKHRLNNNFYQISVKSINRIYDIFIDKTIDLDPKRVQKIIRSDNIFPKIEKCISLIYWEKKPIDILKKIGLDVYPEMKDIIPKTILSYT